MLFERTWSRRDFLVSVAIIDTVKRETLAVENIGEFGKSILIRQNFTYQSFTAYIILSRDPWIP